MLGFGFVYCANSDGLSDSHCDVQDRSDDDYLAAHVPCGDHIRYLHGDKRRCFPRSVLQFHGDCKRHATSDGHVSRKHQYDDQFRLRNGDLYNADGE